MILSKGNRGNDKGGNDLEENANDDAKIDAALRRLCRRRPRKGLQVPEAVHKLWLKGGKTRRDMGKILVQCGGDKVLLP